MMTEQKRWFIALGALSAGIAVMAGAFGAHALKARLAPERLAIFEVGVRYQMYHALALILVGVCGLRSASTLLQASGIAFLVGTVLFSGSLYALTWSGIRVLGAITPLGGVAFLVGWALLAWSALQSPPSSG